MDPAAPRSGAEPEEAYGLHATADLEKGECIKHPGRIFGCGRDFRLLEWTAQSPAVASYAIERI